MSHCTAASFGINIVEVIVRNTRSRSRMRGRQPLPAGGKVWLVKLPWLPSLPKHSNVAVEDVSVLGCTRQIPLVKCPRCASSEPASVPILR